jgi:hypothetical protein
MMLSKAFDETGAGLDAARDGWLHVNIAANRSAGTIRDVIGAGV